MIQPLRAVHRRAFVALAVSAANDPVDRARSAAPSPGPRRKCYRYRGHGEHGERVEQLCGRSIRFSQRSIASRTRPLDRYVELLPAQELNEPDLLLYWARNAPEGNVLPGNAQLVGVFSTGKAFLLPLNEEGAGHLVLFSQAHQTVFDTAVVGKLP